MASGGREVVFFGAAGYTGRLAVQVASRRRMRFAIAGHHRARLEALAKELAPRPEVILADARDPASLRAMARKASIVCSTVGPFAELGEPVVQACIEEGASYFDTSGEQPWVERCIDRFDEPARRANVVVCPSMAYEVAVADCAAAVAVREMRHADEIRIVYHLEDFRSSRGTKLSMLSSLKEGACQWEDARLHRESLAADVHRVVLPNPEGPCSLVSFGSPESLTIPRHAEVRRVRTYIAVPERLGTALAVLAPKISLLLRGPLGGVSRRWVARLPRGGPSAARRSGSRSVVIAVARSRHGAARSVTVHVDDPYGVSGEILAAGARALLDHDVPPGVRAPAEVVRDPAAFLQTLSRWGAEAEMVEADVLTGR